MNRRPSRHHPVNHRARSRRVAALIGLVCLFASIVGPVPAAAEGEYLSFPSAEDFVTAQYQDFLARDPDAAGLAFWAAELRSGVPPSDIVEQLARSAEFGQTMAPLARLYQAYFLRPADAAGLQFWAGERRAGRSLSNVSSRFAESAEFVSRYGDLDDAGFVDLVYRNVLGRPADDAGSAFWIRELERGRSRGDVMLGFSESEEFRIRTENRVLASLLYVGMLRRTPDLAGLDYWAGLLDDGGSYAEAIENFLRAPEYEQRTSAVFAERTPLTGEARRVAPNGPALVVKIDNHDRARPQIGLNDADIVYEELVEGAITRFAAVFHSDIPAVVGPVRSIRTTDLHLLDALGNPLLAASGANRGVLAQVAAADVVNVNALVAGSAYDRAAGRRAPHNLVADTSDLFAAAAGAGGEAPVFGPFRAPRADAAGNPAAGVDIDLGFTEVRYRWNGVGWERTQNGTAHTSADGRRIAPPNVIVQFTTYGTNAIDAESPEAITTGTGVAWIYTGGNRIVGTWTRGSTAEVIRYLDSDGAPVQLAPGRTWVTLAESGTAIHR